MCDGTEMVPLVLPALAGLRLRQVAAPLLWDSDSEQQSHSLPEVLCCFQISLNHAEENLTQGFKLG